MGVIKGRIKEQQVPVSVSEFIKARAYPIGNERDFYSLIGRKVTLNDREIGVFRTSDGGLFALDNVRINPEGIRLTEGIVSRHTVYDPSDDWKVDLETGDVIREAFNITKVQTYRVHNMKGKLYIVVG
ncbi:nitrite reductase (NAD(P)H) small subunit [Paenibacillus sp. 453mf]|uniref:nitrite reductase (NAD(P)H) small subunit n=1 Tax=Paenibacillus sp. 453mf TaxID=1761874 RepID=UPI0008F06A7E|nr:nitrite reductase (NAD(P)H) small subunit [Paenibacillus sp. 453mf]SFS60269.1 assimilatory nitrite reductase (NAD(P)H) small subunit [Paenibacillus sp. 453mf]